MKIRFTVYSILLITILALPIVYKIMDSNIQKQEQSNRQQKENWLLDTSQIELNLARKASNEELFWYHWKRALNYVVLANEMLEEDINSMIIFRLFK